MSKNRKAIVISPDEDALLRNLYTEMRIPSDQYKRRPKELQNLVTAWNRLTSRSDTLEEVLHYIVTQRKKKIKKWPTFGNQHRRLVPLPDTFLSLGEWRALENIYAALMVPDELGTDNLAFDPQLAAALAREFFSRCKRRIAGNLLFAAIMAKRKRGEWVKVRTPKMGEADQGIGFSDIDELAG